MRNHWPSAVVAVDSELQRSVEDGAVPRGHLLRQHRADGPPAVPLECRSRCDGLVDLVWLVVTAPERHRRMVGQEVDGLACLSDCLLAHTPRVAAVQWEVLPHEHAEFVRGLIEL